MPSTDSVELIEDYNDLFEGKKFVFYCSVGRRSPALVSRLGNATLTLGAQSLQNLISGFLGGSTWAIN